MHWDVAVCRELSRHAHGPVSYLCEDFLQWHAGGEIVHLDHSANGHFHHFPWYEIVESTTTPAGLPSSVVRALRDGSADFTLPMLLADELFGARMDAEPTRVFEFYREYDDTLEHALEPLFATVRRRVLREGLVSIPGFVTFKKMELFDGIREHSARKLRAYLNHDGTLAPDLTAFVRDPGARRDAEGALLEACERIRNNQRKDVLLGAALAITAVRLEGYEGRNPRTGEAVPVPPKVIPVFIGWY